MANARPILAITLGSTPQIVPEAFFRERDGYAEVHVLTTSSERLAETMSLIPRFFNAYPSTKFNLSRIHDLPDVGTSEQNARFRETVCRWYLALAGRARELSAPLHLCLSGGRKSMSAEAQRAATLFGADAVFHVLVPDHVRVETLSEIIAVHNAGQIEFAELGSEPGWASCRTLDPVNYPLEEAVDDLGYQSVRAQDFAISEAIAGRLNSTRRKAEGFENVSRYPFTSLALWPEQDREWLKGPLHPATDAAWVRSLPKIELHCHLGGFATHGDLLVAVRRAADRPHVLPARGLSPLMIGWPRPTKPIPLSNYMKLGDSAGSAILKDLGCLRRHCELLYQHLVEENVVYAEIRCSPANYSDPDSGHSAWDVLAKIKEIFDSCMREAKKRAPSVYCRVNLIIIATRREKGDFRTAISRHLALAISAAEHWSRDAGCRVVGVDLAGYEDKETRAHYFREEFIAVHRCGLALTVHAGENDDAEGIWRAVFDLNARRLGHALHLAESRELMRSVADRGIAVEMCPFANYQIKGFHPMPGRPNYPLLKYLREGIPVTVNTDNIGISAASLSDNLLFASELCPGISRLDVLQLQANALNSVFLPPVERDGLRTRIEAALLQS